MAVSAKTLLHRKYIAKCVLQIGYAGLQINCRPPFLRKYEWKLISRFEVKPNMQLQ
jgi:hypothetical protein